MQEQTETTPQATPTVNGVVDEVAQDKQFFEQMESLLSKLVPPDEVVLTTCTGNKITLPGTIAARQQIKVFRLMRSLFDEGEINNILSAFSGEAESSIIDIVLSIATNEVIAEKLGEIFTAAYPTALAGEDPLDVLPLEELITSLVPFSERFIKKLGMGVATLGKNAMELQEN
jgi:hypothetical protein